MSFSVSEVKYVRSYVDSVNPQVIAFVSIPVGVADVYSFSIILRHGISNLHVNLTRQHSSRMRTTHLSTIQLYVFQWPPLGVSTAGGRSSSEQV